jgi:hypothetical protein
VVLDEGVRVKGCKHYKNEEYWNQVVDHVPHSVPISIAYTMDALLKQAMGNISHSITTRNHPLPVHSSDNDQDKFLSTLVTGFVVSFTVIFGMS